MLYSGRRPRLGLISGLVGNMGSKKSTLMIAWANEARWQKEGVLFLQPRESVRAEPDRIVARTKAYYEGAVAIDHSKEILPQVNRSKCRNIFLEEIQFLGKTTEMEETFKQTVLQLRSECYNVFWCGLPTDFRAMPFEVVCWMMGISTFLQPLDVACRQCDGTPAPFAQRLYFGQPAPNSDERFIADTPEMQKLKGVTYEARCVYCFVPPGEPTPELQAIWAAIAAEHGQA